MSRKTPLSVSQVITGYIYAAQARPLSEHTIEEYSNTFRKFTAFLASDPPFESITPDQIIAFIGSSAVSNKTKLNYRTGLSALWSWAVKQSICSANIVHQVDRPARIERPEIVEFSERDIRALLESAAWIHVPQKGKLRSYKRAAKTADRDRAIILTLLDTGVRVSELCSMKISALDVRNNRITVWGKGLKERSIPFSPRTGQALWRYLGSRPDARLDEPLFIGLNRRSLDRVNVLHQMLDIGKRAGVMDCHPHRFRHTFAILFLRGGGNVFTLRYLLGHETLEMTKRYLEIAQADIDAAHHRASPVDQMRL